MATVQCPRCKREFETMFDEVRFHSGHFFDDARGKAYDQLCDDCHRDVVRS